MCVDRGVTLVLRMTRFEADTLCAREIDSDVTFSKTTYTFPQYSPTMFVIDTIKRSVLSRNQQFSRGGKKNFGSVTRYRCHVLKLWDIITINYNRFPSFWICGYSMRSVVLYRNILFTSNLHIYQLVGTFLSYTINIYV